MLIPIRVDRTSKPPMGAPLRSDGHWSVQGISEAWPFNEGAGNLAFSATRRNDISLAGVASLTGNRLSRSGRGAINDAINATSKLGNGAYDLTVLCKVTTKVKQTDQNTIVIGRFYGGLTANNTWGLLTNWVVSGTDFYPGFIIGIGTAQYVVSHNVQYQIGVPEVLAGVRRYDTLELYRGGVKVSESTGKPTGALNINSTPLLFGAIGIDVANSSFQDYEWAMVYVDKALSPSQIASLSANPWQIYEPETVWIEVGSSAALFEGAFSSSFSLSPSISGQLGVGGGLSSTAGSATYANAGKEGKQGPLTTTLAALVQALSAKEGKQGPISLNTAALIQALTGGAGNKGTLAAQTIVNPSLSGNAGNKGTLSSTISLSALFSQAALFEGTVSAAMAAIAPSFAGSAGNLGTLLTTISAASAIAAITGNAGYLQSVLADLALQETGQTGSAGTVALTISTGADMSGKLGVSAEIAATLADLGAYLVEIIVGDKIHRIVIATTTGQAVILTATGTITFN
jgi:hypothetical protein